MFKVFQISFLFILMCCCGLCSDLLAQNSEEELFQVAENAFEDGFYDTARGYVEQLFAQFPKTPKRIPAKLIQGQCYFFQSQYLKAYDVFSELLPYNEYKDATLYWLGETLFKGGDNKKALEYYQQLLDIYPQSSYIPQTLYSLGWLFFGEKEWNEAERRFSRLIGAYPKHPLSEESFFKLAEIAFLQNDYAKAITGFGHYLDRFSNSARAAEGYFYIGESLYYQKDYLNAIVAYAKAAQDAPDDHLAFNAETGLGWAYLQLEKFQMAEEAFARAESLAAKTGDSSENILLGQAKLYSQTQQSGKALETYGKLINGFPQSPRRKEALLGQANLYYQVEDYKQAVKSYQNFIGGFADDAALTEKARFGLAWSCLKMGDIDRSIETFLAVKETSQNRIVKVSALTQAADAYHDAGEYEKALDVYDDILQDYADNSGPYIDYVQYRQAITLLRLNRLEAAALSFQTLEANFPGSEYVSDVKYYLGLAYYKKGDWSTARKYILEYLSGYPKAALTGEAQYILGVSQLNLNEYAGALKTFNDFLEQHPEDALFVPNVEFKIAKCYEGLGQKNEAFKRLSVVYHKYPDLDVSREALQAMGDAYAQTGQTQKAVETYTDFLGKFSAHPSASVVYYNLGQINVARKEYGKAVEMLKSVKPDADGELYGKARLLIADIFSRELDSVSALGICQNIVETSPEFRRDAYAKMGELYKVRFDYAQTLDTYQKALASAQGMSHIENAEIQFWIADTYELMNRKDRAVEEYLKIPYLYPQHIAWVVKSFLRAARIFEDQSRWDEARAIYRKIVEMKVDESKFAQERLGAMGQQK